MLLPCNCSCAQCRDCASDLGPYVKMHLRKPSYQLHHLRHVPAASPLLRHAGSARPATLPHNILRTFDSDGDGKLTLEEVEKVLMLANLPSPAWDQQLACAASSTHKLEDILRLILPKIMPSRSTAVTASSVVWSAAGMFVSILLMGLLAQHAKQLPGALGLWHTKGLGVLLGSFGTITVLLFARPEAEPIKLWNLVIGHVVSVGAVVTVMHVMGPGLLSRAVAMALALAGMLLTDSVHPPGGALVLMAQDSAVIQSLGYWFILYPSLVWTFLILLPVGYATNWLKRHVKFDWPALDVQQLQPAVPLIGGLKSA